MRRNPAVVSTILLASPIAGSGCGGSSSRPERLRAPARARPALAHWRVPLMDFGRRFLLLAVLVVGANCGGTTAHPDGGGGGGSTGGQGGGSAGAGGGSGGAAVDAGTGDRGGAGGSDLICHSNADCQSGQVCYVGVNSCTSPVGGHCVAVLSDGCSGCDCLDIVSGSCPASNGGHCQESTVGGPCWSCALRN